MTEDSRSSEIEALVSAFYPDDVLLLLPFHIMDRAAVTRFIGDAVATLADHAARGLFSSKPVSEAEFTDAIIKRLIENGQWWCWDVIHRAQAGEGDALDNLAALLRWEPHYTWSARRELAMRAGDGEREDVLRRLRQTALWLALQRTETLQTYRYAQRGHWELDANGHKAWSRPIDRDMSRFWWWLRKETRKEMKAGLAPAPTAVTDDERALIAMLDDEERDALQELVGRNAARGKRLDPVAVELLMLKHKGMSIAAASRNLGIKPNAGHQKMHRLDKALKALGDAP